MKPAAEEEGFLVYVMGALEWVRGDYDRAHGWLTRAERHARCVQNPALLGAVLRASAGVALATRREDEAQAMSREAIDCLQHAGCRWDAALAATHEADACEALGQVDAALNVRRQALTCFEALGDPWGRSVCLFGLALGHARQGRFRPARREVHEALAIQQSGGDAWNIAQCLILLADIELAESQYDQASLNLVRSLAELRQVRDRVAIAYVLPRLAAVEYGRRQHTRAATLLGAADTPDVRSAAQYPLRLINDGEQDDLAGQLTAALGEAAFESARSRGMALDLDGAVAMAMGELAAATSDSHSPTPDLRIRLLGKPAIWCGSQRLTAADWTYALPRVLLYYLLLNGPVSKERLGVDLWPDASSSQLRGRFRTTLYQLRKALGDPRWIRYVDGHYAFDDRGSATVDYREFERCTAAGLDLQKSDPERALELLQRGLALYRGTLLEGEDIGGWVVDHQQRLAARCFKVALACSELLAESGRDREACESLVLAVALEPFDEHAVTALAETYWRLGDRTAALRALDALAQRLAEELAVRPQACTRELRQRIARGEDVPPYLSR
jgi:DNA-binding SARP family transcriptional activator